jgi:hypothetical protein
MRRFLLSYFKERMKYLNWRQCFNLLLNFDATYDEQIKCQEMYDNYHEKRRIKNDKTRI